MKPYSTENQLLKDLFWGVALLLILDLALWEINSLWESTSQLLQEGEKLIGHH